jgi:hypothetical protein
MGRTPNERNSAVFNLPEGYSTQVLWHKDIGDTCYEFDRVYGESGHLDEDRSFWLVTPLDQETPIVMHQLSYGKYKSLYGRSAYGFLDFASPSLKPEILHKWLDRASQLVPPYKPDN